LTEEGVFKFNSSKYNDEEEEAAAR